MRRCDGVFVGAAGKLRAEGSGGLEGPGRVRVRAKVRYLDLHPQYKWMQSLGLRSG